MPVLKALVPRSIRILGAAYYSNAQIESAIRHVFGVDTALITDGTYFVVERGAAIAGCGGWSFRAKTYGGDQLGAGEGPVLDPARDAARLRAFFMDPACARQGAGSMLLKASADAARTRGFTRLELVATLPGQPFYARHGFRVIEPVPARLPDGVEIEFVRMGARIDALDLL